MTYSPNIPQPTDDPSDSQPLILINFQQLKSIFNSDHVTWDDATVANRGQHKQISLVDVVANPNLASPKSSVYTKTVGTQNQLFFQNNSAASDVYQLSGGGGAATTWLNYNGVTDTLNASLNVASVVKTNAFTYTINFTKNYADLFYCLQINANSSFTWTDSTRAVSSVKIVSSASATAPSSLNVVIFGNLA